MTSRSQKTVKQCEGCLLNRTTHCLVFFHPAEMWAGGSCKGYNNEELVHRYGSDEHDGQGIYAAKKIRRTKGKDQHNIEHPEEHTKFKKLKFP